MKSLEQTMTESYLVYKHTSPCMKSYIGMTKNMKQRITGHCHPSSTCVAFNAAIQEYGWSQFKTEILAQYLTLKQANQLEKKYIAEHHTMVPNGYNLTSGGQCHRHSEESKVKISAARRRTIREKQRTANEPV